MTIRGARLFREADVERFLAARAERQARRPLFERLAVRREGIR